MVEVVTLEEFKDFRKTVEDRLDASDRKLSKLMEDFRGQQEEAKADFEKAIKDLNARLDVLQESSKGFIDRLREAVRARTAEPSKEEQKSA